MGNLKQSEDTNGQAPTADASDVYMVETMKQNIAVNFMGQIKELPVSDIADGCVGVSLWFDTLEHAAAYNGGKSEISHGRVTGLPTDDSKPTQSELKAPQQGRESEKQ